jgi:hypothetical protein
VFGSIALTLPDQMPNIDIAGGARPPMGSLSESGTEGGTAASTLWLY